MHLIHVVVLLGHVAVLRYRLRLIDPLPHKLVVTAPVVVRVVGKVLRVGEESEITVGVLVAIVELEVGPGRPVSLHGWFGSGLKGGEFTRQETNVYVRFHTVV